MEYRIGDLLRHKTEKDIYMIVYDVRTDIDGTVKLKIQHARHAKQNPNSYVQTYSYVHDKYADKYYEFAGHFDIRKGAEMEVTNEYHVGDLLRHREDKDSYAIIVDICHGYAHPDMLKVQYPGDGGKQEWIGTEFADAHYIRVVSFDIFKRYDEIMKKLDVIEKKLEEKPEEKPEQSVNAEAKAVKAVIEDIEFPTLQAALSAARRIKKYVSVHKYVTANEILSLCGYQCLAAVNGNTMGEYGWLAERFMVRQHLDKNGVPDGTWCLCNPFDPLPIYQLEYWKRFLCIRHSY